MPGNRVYLMTGELMKHPVTWLVLAFIPLGVGMLGLSCAPGIVPQAPPPFELTTKTALDWKSLNGPYERVTFAVAWAPSNRILYAGTWGHSLYRSQDDGKTWEPGSTDKARYIKALAVLPTDEQVIYAGTYNEGLYWSTDGGWTWSQLGDYGPLKAPEDSAHRNRSNFQIESLLVFSDSGTERVLAATRNGVYSSRVYSDTWTHLDSGFRDSDGAYNVQALAYSPGSTRHSSILFAGTLDGLYGSTNGGQEWNYLGPRDGYPGKARHILSLAIVSDTTHYTGTLLIGTAGAGVYTADIESIESQEWLASTIDFTEDARAKTIQALLSAPDGVVYAGTVDHGVLKSIDGGRTWRPIAEGLPSHALSILSLAYDPTNGILYAGTYGDGVYKLRPDSQRWEAANARLPVDFPVQKIAFAGPQSENLFAGLQVGGLYLNTGRQEAEPAWQRVPKALPIGEARDIAGLAVGGPGRATIVIAAATGITRSQDAGQRWERLGSAHKLPDEALKAQALVQGRDNPDILYVALQNTEELRGQPPVPEAGIYRSDDAGDSWQPAHGNLDLALRGQVCCLALGANDDTLYLGLKSSQAITSSQVYTYTYHVYITHDHGTSWQPLSPLSEQDPQDLQELSWSQSSWWDAFLYGEPRHMLYARTDKGIYVSYDDGRSWQLRLRGFYSSLLADPYHPWMVYAASPRTTLSREFAAPISLTPDLWVSDDGGKTWTWAGPGPSTATESTATKSTATKLTASITTLALDPKHTLQLYAGSEGDGVFWADLSSVIPASRPFMPYVTVLAVLTLLVVLLLAAGIAFVVAKGLSVGRPNGLPIRTWPKLAYLSARYRSRVGLVSDAYTPLLPLEQLALALAPDEPFSPTRICQALEAQKIPTNLAQVEKALEQLELRYQLLRRAEDVGYQQTSPLLGRIASARFWDTLDKREKLIQSVRSESQLRADTRQVFQLAGFETSTLDGGFRITSSQAEYSLFGAEQGIYVHLLHTSDVLDAKDVDQIQENAAQAREGQPMSNFSFVATSGLPTVEAYRRIAQLHQEKDFHVMLLADAKVRAANDNATARQTLLRSVRRALGRRDLFILDEPTVDMLDFFGRSDILERIANDCQAGHTIGLIGMVGVGKTSLAQQLVQRLPNAVVAWMDLPTYVTSGVYHRVRQAWRGDAKIKTPDWDSPQLDPLPEQPSLEQISADITAIRDSLLSQTSTTHLVVVVDELADYHIASTDMRVLTQAVALTENVSLLLVCGPSIHDSALFPASLRIHKLRPFPRETSIEMITALAIQMGLQLEEDALAQLHQAAGGHPLVLRQLAHLAQAGRIGGERLIGKALIDQAISQYPSRYDQTLSRLWDSLPEEEQEAMRLAAGLRLSPTSEVAVRLADLGWLEKVNGQWRAFSSVVESWLNARFTS